MCDRESRASFEDACFPPRHLQVDEGLVARGIEGHAPQHCRHHEGAHQRRLWLHLLQASWVWSWE